MRVDDVAGGQYLAGPADTMYSAPPGATSAATLERRKLKLKAKSEAGFIIFQFQALSCRRLQRGFDRVSLHRLTTRASTARCAYGSNPSTV
jgi:hypothetical protein